MPSTVSEEARILRPGVNCRELVRARRAAVLIDGAAYFAAFRAAAALARHCLFIVGWDIDSRVRLLRGDCDDGLPPSLGEFLIALLQRRSELQVFVLAWDFAMLYALERELLPIYSAGWHRHPRLHFRFDGRHPVGASHHQKIVVVDDALAFAGGLDLTKHRWDTPQHPAQDPRRRAPNGQRYAPFHDVQLMVEGEAAAALGGLVRERWQAAGGRPPPASRPLQASPWPSATPPDFEEVEIGVARTAPRYRERAAVEEVKRLYLDSIAAARRSIYIENQYFTAQAVGNALAARLRTAQPPEILLVSRLRCDGWLEQRSMEALRARLLARLAASDVHGRLRACYPEQAGLDGAYIRLHSKVMVVDDRLLRIGSSNLSNRSMGLDTECDLALEARSERQRAAIRAVRERLLAEHLGAEPSRVAEEIERSGSLFAALDALGGRPRTLRPLPTGAHEAGGLIARPDLLDPERPVGPETLVSEFVPPEERPQAGARIALAAGLLLATSALAALWRWGPLGAWLGATVLPAAAAVAGSPQAPLWVLGAYLAGSLSAVPITVLIVLTVLVFGPLPGFAYALGGSLLGAAAGFALGRALGRDTVRRLSGSRLNRLSRRLARRVVVAVFTLRLLPVAPFTVVNLVAGASHLRFRDFLLGSALGLSPGILALTVFSDRVAAAVRESSPVTLTLLAFACAAIGAAGLALRAWLRRRAAREASRPGAAGA